jgi:hypothetical protein
MRRQTAWKHIYVQSKRKKEIQEELVVDGKANFTSENRNGLQRIQCEGKEREWNSRREEKRREENLSPLNTSLPSADGLQFLRLAMKAMAGMWINMVSATLYKHLPNLQH